LECILDFALSRNTCPKVLKKFLQNAEILARLSAASGRVDPAQSLVGELYVDDEAEDS